MIIDKRDECKKWERKYKKRNQKIKKTFTKLHQDIKNIKLDLYRKTQITIELEKFIKVQHFQLEESKKCAPILNPPELKEGETPKCPICLCYIDTNFFDCTLLECCKKNIHAHCLYKHLRHNQNCPCCRKLIQTTSDYEADYSSPENFSSNDIINDSYLTEEIQRFEKQLKLCVWCHTRVVLGCRCTNPQPHYYHANCQAKATSLREMFNVNLSEKDKWRCRGNCQYPS